MSKGPFTASFTLTQETPTAPIYSTLELSPRIGNDSDEIPQVYEIMCKYATDYLYLAGMVDEEGNLVDEEAFHEQTKIKATPKPASNRKH